MNPLLQTCEPLLAPVPRRRPGRLDTAVELLDSLDAVWRAVAQACAHPGWLCLSDRVLRCPCTVTPQPGVFPLDGEWRLGDRQSLHLRHQGEGRWRLTTFTRCQDPDPAGSYLVPRQFVAVEGGMQHYEVEWRLVEDPFGHQRFQPRTARFVGFGTEEGSQP